MNGWVLVDIAGCSSPIVVSVSTGLKPIGDCVTGSGDVPQEELGPALDCEDAEGELVAPPTLKLAESKLARDAFVIELLMDGVKPVLNLANSSLNWALNAASCPLTPFLLIAEDPGVFC